MIDRAHPVPPVRGRGEPFPVLQGCGKERVNMAGFEYDITKHGAEAFSRVAYFCSEKGECGVEEVSADQLQVMRDILNNRGAEAGSWFSSSSGRRAW